MNAPECCGAFCEEVCRCSLPCAQCEHKRHHGEGWCYMFREPPQGAFCGQFQPVRVVRR